MRIGLDARTMVGETGVAQYGRNLVKRLPDADAEDEFVRFDANGERIPFWTSQVSFRSRLMRSKIDLLHVLGGAPPLFYRKPYVLTVHDLIIYRHPEWFPDGQIFSTRFAYPRAIASARRIIVPSKATKTDLVDMFKVKEEKIAVIPHGVAFQIPSSRGKSEAGDAAIPGGLLRRGVYPEQSRRTPRNDVKRYILFLGTIEPRKNIPTLIKAYRKTVDGNQGLKDVGLVIAGAVGWKADRIVDEIRKTQCEGYDIALSGPVMEEEKWRLLRNASVLALPSFCEGFGMQVLEAMAAGAPVACSSDPSLADAAGDAALLLDPGDAEAWAAGLKNILENEKFAGDLAAKGLARAKAMTWEKTAAETVAVYRSFSV